MSKRNKFIPIQIKIDLVSDWLFDNLKTTEVRNKYEISHSNLYSWIGNRDILEQISKKRRISVPKLKKIITTRLEKNRYKGIDLKIKVDALTDWLFNDLGKNQIIDKYKINGSNLYAWVRNDSLLEAITQKRGISAQKLKKIVAKKFESNKPHDLKTKVAAISDYLLSDFKKNQITEKYGICEATFYHWLSSDAILMQLSKQKRIDIKKIKYIIQKKVNWHQKKLQEKVDAVSDLLFNNLGKHQIRDKYKICGSEVYTWLRDDVVLEQIAKDKGINFQELKRLRDFKMQRRKSPQFLADYIKSDKKLMETVSAILSSFGENGHESKEYVFNHIVSRMIPGSVKFSVWSLGPYLGDITVGRSNLPAEDYIRRIPPEFLDQDPRLEHEFYKLLEKQVRRNFYDSPERTVSEIKQKADSEQNEFVKRLWYKLYDNLNGIQNYDLIRNANSRIPNPEYKGGKNYGKI